MLRLPATLALVGTLAHPGAAVADGIYSFVDGDGVVHYTNVPHQPGYQLVLGSKPGRGSQRGTRAEGAVPPLLRRTSEFDEHIRAAAEKYGLAPLLLKAVMAVESNFDPAAISRKGAAGLMQLMPQTARDMYVDDRLDPAQSIEGGARYLRLLHDQFGGDLERILAAYNAGPERVRRSGGAVPAIPETQAYVRKVLGLYAAYRKKG
jgi:soluble lytic murein transglycosylase-like protein